MFGERVRQARLAAGLTLGELAERLDRPISKQALSKYERGLSQPLPSRVMDLAMALNVRPSWLLSEPAVTITWVAYRKLHKLSKARQERVTAVATQRLEGELRLREMFHLGERHDLPGPLDVQRPEDCEYAAAALRMRWSLGDRPVDRLVERIEENGGAVVTWPEAWGFDGLSGWANQTPVIVLNQSVSTARLRFNAAHELGHLVMKSTGDGQNDESFAHRFAASFLVPAEAARRELGTRRQALDLAELGCLKQRWGLSMQAWIRRARDLDIIGDALYRRLNMQLREQGWHEDEPYAYEPPEWPTLLRRLALRALSERLITYDDANLLDPSTTYQPYGGRAEPSLLERLIWMPLDERHRAIQEAGFSIDLEEIEAWDLTAGDGLED